MNIETTKIPNEVLHSKDLTPLERLILISIIAFKHPVITEEYLWLNVLNHQITASNVEKIITSLEKKEWIMIKKHYDQEGSGDRVISINWLKIYQPDKSRNFPPSV
jgi:hypothetical protein